jgi:hypothetical protein
LNLRVRLEGDMYDLSTIQPESGFYDTSTNEIVWNSGAVSNLGSLAPAQNGQVVFRVKLKNSFPSSGAGARNFTIKSTATLATSNVPSSIEADEISSQASLITKISAQPTLTQAIYFGDNGYGNSGSGAMPLQVGQETVLTINWDINNPGSDVKNVKVVGVLPTGIEWVGAASTNVGSDVSAGVVFDKNRSEISWTISKVPQGAGLFSEKYRASFQIKVKPAPNQQGSPVNLIKNVSMVGSDPFTQQDINIKLRDYTSNDIVDRPGQGTVK